MQVRLALASDLPPLRQRLSSVFGPQRAGRRLDPASELIRAMLAAQTPDETAWAAFVRLRAAFPDWTPLAEAEAADIERLIDPVAFADRKARQLPVLARVICIRVGALSLDHLGDVSPEAAMTWLTSLPGVGVTAAAATLNFSTLAGRALVVDSHIQRVARRLGLVARGADARDAHEALTAAIPQDWTADDLYELHWLMKPHGQSICSHFDPACGLCALRDICPRVGVAGDQTARIAPFERPGRIAEQNRQTETDDLAAPVGWRRDPR